jgi:hypothetical protein
MYHSTLDSLSEEILDQIFFYIDHTHKPTLRALAIVNHHFHALACPFLFSTLRLRIKDQNSVSSIIPTLPARVIQHTRHLIIESHEILSHFGLSSSNEIRDSFFHSARQNWEVLERSGGGPFLTGFAEDTKWKPLAGSITQMAVLRDLTYNYACQLAPCILETLERAQPQCRLHINTFYLRFLEGKDKFHPYLDLQNHELALAISPCLYSVAAAIRAPPDYNGNAIKELATGLAPNLKRIHCFPTQASAELGEEFSEIQSWQGFKIENKEESTKAQIQPRRSLSCLLLENGDAENWHAFTSFSDIHRFEFDGFLLDQLSYLTTCDFASLQTLNFNLGNPHPAYNSYLDDFDMPMRDLLMSIPPLIALKITGGAGPLTFDAITNNHGSRLRRLHFVPQQRKEQFVLDAQRIMELKNSSPLLEELTIKTPRSKGDETEVAIYKALGSIARLQILYLVLDASIYAAAPSEDADYGPEDPDYDDQVPNDPSFDSADQEIIPIILPNLEGLRKGFARQAFINSAVDEALASSIFNAISAGKSRSGALQLEKLGIWITGHFQVDNGTSFDLAQFQILAKYVDRSWIVERNPRDDSRDQLVLSNITRNMAGPLTTFRSEHAEECFRGLWPGVSTSGLEGDEKDWRANWHSFPLRGV